MITEIQGDMFESQAEALVNAVNTVGVMGGGIAWEFKNRFPEAYDEYREECDAGRFAVGDILMNPTGIVAPKWIAQFPTKDHYGNPSKMSYVESGLDTLIVKIAEYDLESIAIPALGCGLGGLRWSEVKRLIHDKLGNLDIDIELYIPHERWE